MIALLTTSAFWIGFTTGFVFLIFVCFIWVWMSPGRIRRGVKKFEDQREIQAERERQKKIWKQFYVSQKPIK